MLPCLIGEKKKAFKIGAQLRFSRGIRRFRTQRAHKRQVSKMHRNGQRRSSKLSPFARLKKVVQGVSFREETRILSFQRSQKETF